MLRKLVGLAVIMGGAVAGYRLVVKPWWKGWGVVPGEAEESLPGDEIVDAGTTAETRSITIDARPGEVWPWLVQMGFDRAGWYSYDQIDMNHRSADRILDEHQSLAVGDVVPTHHAGGFVVKAIEPERHFVLYSDTDLVRQQAQAAAEADPTPANVKLAGAFMENAQPSEFAVSWAFVLREVEPGRTRLTERVRVKFGDEEQPWMRFTMPLMGFGVFVMIRKQLLGIRERAERARADTEAVAVA